MVAKSREEILAKMDDDLERLRPLMTRLYPESPDVNLRRRKIVAMRENGASFQAIGDLFDMSAEEVSAEYKVTVIAYPELDLHHERLLELNRLDAYLFYLQEQIDKGDVKAIQTALKISESRRKLLGLDQPFRIEQTVETKTKLDAEIDTLLAEMAAAPRSTRSESA